MENPLKNPGFRQFLARTCIFLAIGIAVALFVTAYFRHTNFYSTHLEIPNEFQLEKPNIRTIFLNACLTGFVAFLIISYKKLSFLPVYRFRRKQIFFVLMAAAFLVLHYILKFLIGTNLEFFIKNQAFWGAAKIGINLLFVASLALGMYGTEFAKDFIRNFRKEMLLFGAIAAGFFFLMLAVQNLWALFSSVISQILFWVFGIFSDDVALTQFVSSKSMIEGGGPLLKYESFSAIIGKPCSGIDSLLLFATLYIIILCLDYKRLKKTSMIIAFIAGAFGMFATNIARILILFIIGAKMSPELAVGLFHNNLGWILFIAYFVAFWWVASKYVYKKA